VWVIRNTRELVLIFTIRQKSIINSVKWFWSKWQKHNGSTEKEIALFYICFWVGKTIFLIFLMQYTWQSKTTDNCLTTWLVPHVDHVDVVCLMVFNATFNNISAISWQSVLLVEEAGRPGENHLPVASHWQTLSHNVISSAPRLSGVRTHNFSGDRH
jgi:hypothetical protein